MTTLLQTVITLILIIVIVSSSSPIIDTLPDGAFSASSVFCNGGPTSGCAAKNVRYSSLPITNAWCPHTQDFLAFCPAPPPIDATPYIQIDLGACYRITDFGTKGRPGLFMGAPINQWTDTYKLSYSTTGFGTLTEYNGGQILVGNTDITRETEVLGISSECGDPSFVARYIQFAQESWHVAYPSVRLEAYGITDNDCDATTDCLCSDGITEGIAQTYNCNDLIDSNDDGFPSLGKCDDFNVECTITICRCPDEICTYDPTIDPTIDPTRDPTIDPTIDPTFDPTIDPTRDPTIDPTIDPTSDPTSDPTRNPVIDATIDPTSDPTIDPTRDPTIDPTIDPTSDPTDDPTKDPTSDPTNNPTQDPIDSSDDSSSEEESSDEDCCKSCLPSDLSEQGIRNINAVESEEAGTVSSGQELFLGQESLQDNTQQESASVSSENIARDRATIRPTERPTIRPIVRPNIRSESGSASSEAAFVSRKNAAGDVYGNENESKTLDLSSAQWEHSQILMFDGMLIVSIILNCVFLFHHCIDRKRQNLQQRINYDNNDIEDLP